MSVENTWPVLRNQNEFEICLCHRSGIYCRSAQSDYMEGYTPVTDLLRHALYEDDEVKDAIVKPVVVNILSINILDYLIKTFIICVQKKIPIIKP